MDQDNYTKMLMSLKVYNEVGGLLKMTMEQLENMPKDVMINLAPNEIALVWDKLPEHLKNDSDMLKYRFCHEHYCADDANSDQADGPPPRRLFCCYCKVSGVNITTDNCIKTTHVENKMTSILNFLGCCCCCCTRCKPE